MQKSNKSTILISFANQDLIIILNPSISLHRFSRKADHRKVTSNLVNERLERDHRRGLRAQVDVRHFKAAGRRFDGAQCWHVDVPQRRFVVETRGLGIGTRRWRAKMDQK